MNLELRINKKERIYSADFVSARHYRTLLKHDKEIDYFDMSLEDYDKVVGFICDVFDNQFTMDEFYEGVRSHELNGVILSVFTYVRTGQEANLEVLEGNELGK